MGWNRHAAALLAALALLAAPWVLPPFHTALLIDIGLASTVVIGLVVLTGIAGMTSFGQAMFVGVGAYASGVLSTAWGWPPLAGLCAGVVLAAAIATLIGALTVRLSGYYLVLGTLAWGISAFYVFGNVALLGGQNGLADIPPLQFLGAPLGSKGSYYLVWGVAVAAAIVTLNLLDSRTGRAIRTLRNPMLAESFGVRIDGLRLAVFVYAAVLAAVAGWLQVHYLRFVNPTPYGLDASIEYAFMLVVGGATQVIGAIVGAGVLIAGKTALQIVLPKLSPAIAHWDTIVFGLMIVFIFHHARSGILGPARPRRRRQQRSAVEELSCDAAAAGTAVSARPLGAEGAAPGTLSVRGVRKRFGTLMAVDRVSFDVAPGQIVGVIGPNGAGKSTLFNLITGTTGLDEGSVWLGDVCISRMQPHDVVRHRVARTFQHVQLRPGQSVLQNAKLGAHWLGKGGFVASLLRLERREEAALTERALRAIHRAGLQDAADAEAASLPLGKQRIVEIARALTAAPAVLLLDEPAAGLRYQEKADLAALIRSLSEEGMTVLIVEHDMEFLMNLAEKVVVINCGTKLCEGPPEQVQDDPRVAETYLGVES